jgi:hypothetical protein
MGHGGSMSHSGFAGPARSPGYSGIIGIQRPSSFSPPGRFPMPGRLDPPSRSGTGLPSGHQLSGYIHPHRPGYPGRYPYRDRYRDHDRDRRRGGGRTGQFFSYGYPYAYTYPYVVDPGFYDWGPSDYAENEQGMNANGYADANAPSDQAGYPVEPPYTGDVPDTQPRGYAEPSAASAPPQRQEYHFAAPVSTKPLTVMFKSGRAPMTMQNYMVNSTDLTDLDGEHFEKIPLDQVDIAATQRANRSSGIDFQIPVPSHD